jgi:hypothetical protein
LAGIAFAASTKPTPFVILLLVIHLAFSVNGVTNP